MILVSGAVLLGAGSVWGLPGEVLWDMPSPGKAATGLAFDGKQIWVADHVLDEILSVTPRGKGVGKRYKSPGHRPAGLVFDGKFLWNVDALEAKIYCLRPEDGVVVRVIPAPVTKPQALAHDGKALWVSDNATRAIHRVEPLDGTTIREIPFPGPSVDGLAFDGTYLWVADRISDRLYALTPETGEVVVSLRSPGPYPSGLAWTGKELLNVDYQSDRIFALRRDDSSFLVQESPRDIWVLFTEELRNYGPEPLLDAELLLAVPQSEDSQQLLSGPEYSQKPEHIDEDQWGQKVARFAFPKVPAGQSARVQMKVHVQARAVRYVIFPDKVQGLEKIPKPVRERYLVDNPKYDMKNPLIRSALAEAVGSERNPYWIARKIYRYLHQKIRYEMVGGWDVAPKVLERGSGSCSEYSFVFISMCRAAGLPARYAGALVVRKDAASFDDVFHRWVEVYLAPFGWIPVDPSRGDKATEVERADAFGGLEHDFLITTHGGGGSRLLDWYYNYHERYGCQGRCKVESEPIAEWSPEEPDLVKRP